MDNVTLLYLFIVFHFPSSSFAHNLIHFCKKWWNGVCTIAQVNNLATELLMTFFNSKLSFADLLAVCAFVLFCMYCIWTFGAHLHVRFVLFNLNDAGYILFWKLSASHFKVLVHPGTNAVAWSYVVEIWTERSYIWLCLNCGFTFCLFLHVHAN